MVPSLSTVIDSAPTTDKTLLTVNRRGPKTLLSLLHRVFDGQPVTLGDLTVPEHDEDIVLLVSEGRVTAVSPMGPLRDTLLLVNADHYRTGTRVIEETAIPDVLVGLTEVEFAVRGFPASNKEKLLLILISRLIETRALAAGEGTYHVGFQYLSRLDKEYGTRAVHELLAETDLDMHIYGSRDGENLAADTLGASVHDGDSQELLDSWFVVFDPPAGQGGEIALVAIQTAPNEWRGLWTESTERVAEIATYITESFQ